MFSLLKRLIDVQPGELRALGWSWLYIFSVLSSYYILRPIRDEMGVAGGIENLPWLFTATLVGMIVINPAFAALVSRYSRARFIAMTYRFFILNLLIFFALLKLADPAQNIWIGRVFFVWTSVYNLFVVSVFWAVMVDVFDSEQSKRLFGFIAAGATLGGIAGSAITASLAKLMPVAYLFLVSGCLLEVAVLGVRRLSSLSDSLERRPAAQNEETPIGGSIFAGLIHACRSPYLLQVCLFIMLFTVTSTFLYFQQAEVARQSFADRSARTAFFARVDLWVNVLTLGAQLYLTGRMLKRIGVALTLATLPLLSALGFAALAMSPTIAVIVAFQVLRRASNFAFARPSREVLFTVVPREDKYKAKSFIDTVVYRLGDQIGAWSYTGLGLLSLGVAGISGVAALLSAVWIVNAVWLGRRQATMESAGG